MGSNDGRSQRNHSNPLVSLLAREHPQPFRKSARQLIALQVHSIQIAKTLKRVWQHTFEMIANQHETKQQREGYQTKLEWFPKFLYR